ncbi:hypothetical protein Q5P01_020948 [Channa striata]|uniref:Uncharacterized protein n=1 Tax=Channa striata TaxID=64152 RepID=A0AA88S4C0_CHASR|nr:hypothetical protein Q5P01_020948 [Channa striata]
MDSSASPSPRPSPLFSTGAAGYLQTTLMSEPSPRLQAAATSFDNSLRRCRETPQDARLSAARVWTQPVVLERFSGLNCGGVMGTTETDSTAGQYSSGVGSQTELLRRENGRAQPGGGSSPAHAA